MTKVLEDNGFEVVMFGRRFSGNTYEDLDEAAAAEFKLGELYTCGYTWNRTVSFTPSLCRIKRGIAIFDLVYKPNPTPLMMEGAQRGAKVLGGEKMLIEQRNNHGNCSMTLTTKICR